MYQFDVCSTAGARCAAPRASLCFYVRSLTGPAPLVAEAKAEPLEATGKPWSRTTPRFPFAYSRRLDIRDVFSRPFSVACDFSGPLSHRVVELSRKSSLFYHSMRSEAFLGGRAPVRLFRRAPSE